MKYLGISHIQDMNSKYFLYFVFCILVSSNQHLKLLTKNPVLVHSLTFKYLMLTWHFGFLLFLDNVHLQRIQTDSKYQLKIGGNVKNFPSNGYPIFFKAYKRYAKLKKIDETRTDYVEINRYCFRIITLYNLI